MDSLLKRTIVLKVDPNSPDKEVIEFCAAAIKQGKLVAFPTETVYGLAANLLDEKAVERLYKVKSRPGTKPFTVHISDIKTIKNMGCELTKSAAALAAKFWPGPLTMVIKSDKGAAIGFRMPANRIAFDLINRSGVPVVAPSANLSGSKPAQSAEEVLKDLDGKIDIIIDGGRTKIGIESTVIDMTAAPPKILREGAISRAVVEKYLASIL